ncbi:MAG: DUF6607 family protein [Bacteroidota bacterium]
MKYLLTLISFFTLASLFAQNEATKKSQDREAILAMSGCFDVSFKYTETFAPEVDYEKGYDYTSGALEYSKVVESSDDKIVLQHLLVLNDSMIIKHWRQDWTFEKESYHNFYKDNVWHVKQVDQDEITGTWTQEVFQVDDSPRYSGHATWTHVDGRSEWYRKADSPLPRREYTKRDDYNLMKRGNRVRVIDEGWVHEQDNDKVIREDDKDDVLLVQEKGYNNYVRKPDSECQAAIDWWAANHEKWDTVREIWDGVYASHQTLELVNKVNDKRLYEHLFFNPMYEKREAISDLIATYIITGASTEDIQP